MKNTRYRTALLAAFIAATAALSLIGTSSGPAQTLPPDESPFELEARVNPPSAPVGSSFEFTFTVTNRSEVVARFTVGGCPVHYRIDGVYSPVRGCPEIVLEIELESGQSVTFGPDESGQLVFDPREFPLGPGAHRVVLAAQGVGATAAEFTVEPPAEHIASAAGQVTHPDGRPVSTGVAVLSRGVSDVTDPRVAGGETDAYRASLNSQGYFSFAEVEPNGYLLRVHAEGRTLWYPGVFDPLMSKRLFLPPGEFSGGLNVVLQSPEFHVLEGTVNEVDQIAEGIPLAEAVVLAIPVWPEARDTTWENVSSVESEGTSSSEGGFRMAVTDPEGRFRLEVPEGIYRLLAGKLVDHRYQYWNHVAAFPEAERVRVPDLTMRPGLAHRFDLARLDNADLGGIAGQVLAIDPMTDSPPEPLPDAEVMALPILPSNLADIAPNRTRTDADGFYRLEVPADTPYRVAAGAPNHAPQFYGNTNRPAGARWVDVAPGRTRDGVDLVLQTVPSGTGTIEGLVFRRLPDTECEELAGNTCLIPAAGALVRITPAFPTFAPVDIRTRVGRDGHFRVDGLTADDAGGLAYFVSAQFEEQEPGFYPGGVPFPEAEPLPVFSGRVTSAGRIVLPVYRDASQDGFVGGWVRDPEENPVEHAVIRVYLEPDRPDGRVAQGLTDAEGYFLIGNLPAGVGVLVAADAEGYVPTYYPDAYRWSRAELVSTSGPNMRVAAIRMTLSGKASHGPFVQAGRVRVAEADVEEAFSGFRDPRLVPYAHHRFLRGAFFYLFETASSMSEQPVAGAATGDNGAVILSGLGAGTYVALADRPGFEPAYFAVEGDGRATRIQLDETTPAILADIALHPLGYDEEPEEPDEREVMVTNLTNVPNPFQPRTSIRYQLEVRARVSVQIFDYRGRIVRSLIEAQEQQAGSQEVPWDGRDGDGKRVSSGVYFYRIQAGKYVVARKMVLLP